MKNQLTTPEGKDWLRGLLKTDVVQIEFMKKDGTLREMKCTLKEESIPEASRPKGSGKSQNDDSIAVFDLVKQEWRSFRFDSVKQLAFSFGEE
jgi:hypothetical protein